MRALLLLCAGILSGCMTVTKYEKDVLPTARTFDVPKDKVWTLVVSEVGTKYPVRSIEKDSGLLTTDSVAVRAGTMNSEMGKWVMPPTIKQPMAIWDGLKVSLSVLVTEPQPGKTHVNIRSHYEAYFQQGKQWFVCESNGRLEDSILNRIESQLQ
jgi:hypothetical protein